MKKKVITEYPKVSIITCVLNGEKYISKLLDSVLNMGYPNIEHIIVNDGSTDSTEDIVLKYAELYKNKENSNLYIKYIKQENMGLGGATNTGLKEITGEYWTWINCDDWYGPKAFNEAVTRFNQKIDMVFLNQIYVKDDDNGNVVYEKALNKHLEKVFSNTKNYRRFVIYPWCPQFHYLLKTSTFDRINPSRSIVAYKYNQDLQILYPIALDVNICLSKESLTYYYRARSDNLASSYKSLVKTKVEFNDLFLAAITSFQYTSFNIEERLSRMCLYILGTYRLKFYSLYQSGDFNSYCELYGNRYLPLKKKILVKHRHYLDYKLFLMKLASSHILFRICYDSAKRICGYFKMLIK